MRRIPRWQLVVNADAAAPAPWQNNGTWSGTSPPFSNTPTLGSELFVNGNLETWTNATTPGTWTKSIAGTTTINQETVDFHGGANAIRIDVDASSSTGHIFQVVATAGNWYQLSVWMKNSTTGKNAFMGSTNNPWAAAVSAALTTSYAQYVASGRAAGTAVLIGKNSAASSSVYMDDASFKQITLNTLFNVRAGNSLPNSVSATGTIVLGNTAGVVYGLDSISAPTNGIIATHDGLTGIVLLKLVAGVLTALITTTATYISGVLPEIRWVSANTFALYYNNIQRGANQTISDAGTGNLHGVLSTYSGNTITGVLVS